LDAKHKEVPYILQKATPKPDSVFFREYKIFSLNIADKHTTLVLQNPNKATIDNIELIIKNADVTKVLRLSGSDDMKQWYVIDNDYYISDVYSNTSTAVVKIVDFPKSDYTYFKIEIPDYKSPPINILKAGYYDTHKEYATYTELPAARINQVDSVQDKNSYVRLKFDEPQRIDKLSIQIQGPHYYYRNCYIGQLTEEKNKNGSVKKYLQTLSENFTLSTNGNNTINIPAITTGELYLVINNDDNPPLKITAVKSFQITNTLLAYLPKGNSYIVAFGNKRASSPTYDLANFKDSISSVKTISVGNILAITKNEVEAKAGNTLFGNKAIIWIALVLVLLLLGLMSVRMIKDMGKK
jgi:hypothetical protein